MKTLDINIKMPPVVKDIAKAIHKAGGKSFAVGGTVRDTLFNLIHNMNLDSKDIDVEVFGLPTDKLVSILRLFGKVDEVGKSFGVIKVTIGDLDLDFSLPRTEVKTGTGHKGFDVVPDHTMTVEQAVMRRDFSINALMVNLMTGELIDLVGGLDDIKNRLLRHVSDAFAEDPLRVLRGMQFAARFKLDMVDDSVDMCRSLLSEFNSIAKERLWIEWEKFLSKGIEFHKGLDVLFNSRWFSKFGLTFANIAKTVERLNKLPSMAISRNQRVVIGLALLELNSKISLVDFLTDERGIVREVQELLNISSSNTDLVIAGVGLKERLKLSIGQHKKHCSLDTIVSFFKSMCHVDVVSILDSLTDEMFKPKITGKDLIKAGWNPAKMKEAFGEELDRLFILQLKENLSKEELLTKINQCV